MHKVDTLCGEKDKKTAGARKCIPGAPLTCNSLTIFSVIILESGVVEPPPPPFPPPAWLLLTPVLFGVLLRPPPAPGGVCPPVAVDGVPPPPPPPPPPAGGCPRFSPGGIDGGPLACCQKSGFILKTDRADCCCTSADMEEASGIGVARRSKGVVYVVVMSVMLTRVWSKNRVESQK